MLNRRPFLLVLFVAAILLAGCATNLGPKSYTTEVRDNYMENCIAGSTGGLGATGAATYCECTYNELQKSIDFDHFKDFEAYLREHVGDDVNTREDLEKQGGVKYADIIRVLDGCVTQGPTAPTASTTAPTTSTAR